MNSIQPAFDKGPASESGRRVDSVAWAAFFIWAGLTMLMEVPWGWFLVGVGALTLATQLFHWQMDHQADRFWIACGVVFLAGGVWMLLQIQWPLAPLLIILLGVVLLGRAFMGWKRTSSSSPQPK